MSVEQERKQVLRSYFIYSKKKTLKVYLIK